MTADMIAQGARVSLRGISKWYGSVPAVKELSLEVAQGEFLTLLGPSGSGKTTTLKMIAGFERPTRGDIFIADERVTHLPPHKRDIGMVFQNYALFPHMTVFQNVAFPLTVRTVRPTDIDRQVAAALKLVRLGELGTRYPTQLSGGQQQRVALARALVYNPRVLLMDEPLGALDRKLRDLMQLEIKQLQRLLGITVVYVTHDQEEALTLSDRLAVMNEAQLEQIGSPHEVYERPATAFVADFVGETNFLSGVIVAVLESGQTVVEVNGWKFSALERSQSQVGDPVRIAVRPERVWLSGRGSGGVPGTVEEVIYIGSTTRYLVETAVGRLTVRTQNQTADDPWRKGHDVDVNWDPSRTVVVA
jgi:spermidine/putrescine ABC transporter ATP-binding subunit